MASTYKAILLLLIPWIGFTSRAQSPQWEWALSIGESQWEEAKQVAVDQATKHVYVVGDWEGNLASILPGGVNPSTQFDATYGLMDGYVSKYDQDGNLIWAFKVGGENDDQINSIALDQEGNIYITGYMGEGSAIYFSGTSPHTGGSTLTNSAFEDFFLAKYSPDGEFQWVRRSESDEGYLKGSAVTTNSTAVYAGGSYDSDTADFGSLSLLHNPTRDDFFLIKYTLNGDEQWLTENGTNEDDELNALAADETGVYLLGTFYGSNMSFRDAEGTAIVSPNNANYGTGEIVFARYDTDGNVLWGESVYGEGDDHAFDITMDADSLYITGAINDNADFPAYPEDALSTSGMQDIFLASLAKTDGSTGWVHILPCTNDGDEAGRSVDIDAFGNLYVTGHYSGDLQFPGGVTLSSAGEEDVFVAAFTGYGDFQWAVTAGSSLTDMGNGIASGPGGTIYISGRHEGFMNLGSLILPESPDANGYLAKLQDSLPSLPVADPGPYGDVCGNTLGLQAIPSSGTGVWSLVSGPGIAAFTPSENDPTVSLQVDLFGSYTFAWSETNLAGTTDSIFTIEFYEPVLADAGSGGDTCGPGFQLSAVPGTGAGMWTKLSGPGSASFSPSADVPDAMVWADQPGMYQFTWTETNGLCVDEKSIEVNYLDDMTVDAGPDTTVCGLQHDLNAIPQDIPGSWTLLYGTGNANFSPSGTDPAVQVSADTHGEYLFKWEARQGFCTGEDSVLIVFAAAPIANAGPDQVLEHRFSTYLEAELPDADVAAVNATGRWTLVRGSGLIDNPRDPATLVSGLKLGENVFQWTVASDYCPEVSDQVKLTVKDLETYTVITPNNDGLNDELVFPGIEELDDCEIIIYNRWGTEVYRNAAYRNNWDGRDHNERELIPDTYYYILRIPPDRIIKSFVEIRRSQQ